MDIRGHTVRRLLIEAGADIESEMYLSITVDREAKKPLILFSTEGGVEIEEVAERNPEAIVRLHVDPLLGLLPYQVRELTFSAGLEGDVPREWAGAPQPVRGVRGAGREPCGDKPLVVTGDGRVLALDAKVTVDNSSLYRHEDIAKMHDVEAADPQEQRAQEVGLQYVKLDGDVGILGNGAGLVMSTLDVVAQAGGEPANFCDVGGGADAEKISTALDIVTSNEQVKSVLFNIFGGITRGDEVARGLLSAIERTGIDLPIVVRLDGTNAEEGRQILAENTPRERRDRGDDARRGPQGRRAGAGRRAVMAILVDDNTRLLVQGITGREGAFHTGRMLESGTNVVAGVTPGKGGQDYEGVPVFDTVEKAVEETGANASVIFVPPPSPRTPSSSRSTGP